MKKIHVSRVMKLVALLLPVALFVTLTQSFFFNRLDYNTKCMHCFYNEPDKTLDVVFIGASDVFSGFSPAYAYAKYGYTSYPYAIDSNPASLYKAELKEVLKHQQPQLILVEIDGFLYPDDGALSRQSPLRNFTEHMPFSMNKLSTIASYDCDDKLSCLFPFIKYHGKWRNFGYIRDSYKFRTQNYDAPSLLKGTVTKPLIETTPQEYNIQNDFTTCDITEKSESLLIDFLNYCRDEKLDNVIFVRFPHRFVERGEYDRFTRANAVEEIITQNGLEFLNLERLTSEFNLDYSHDFYNNDHLNIYGQLKLTEYLSELIVSKYHVVPMPQSVENRAQWDLSAQYVEQFNALVKEKYQNGADEFIWESADTIKLLQRMVEKTS